MENLVDFSKYQKKEVVETEVLEVIEAPKPIARKTDKKILPLEKIEKQKIVPKTPEKSIKKAELESIHIEKLNDDVKILLDGSDKWIMTKLTDKTNKRVLSGNLGMLHKKNYGNMREKEIYKTYVDLFMELSKNND